MNGCALDRFFGTGKEPGLSIYEEVVPMRILPSYLIKSILAEDIEEMEALGIYEVAEEDFALCEYICPSKTEFQQIIRKGLNLMEKEG